MIDSVKIDSDGNFYIKASAPENPDLYLLRLDNRSINLSVDSVETISIYAKAGNFAMQYQVEGSEGTEKIRQVILAKELLNTNVADLSGQYDREVITENEYLEKLQGYINDYKNHIKELIVSDPKKPAAYFALFQKFNDYLILDPYDKDDSKMYAAVATSWDHYYKDSPRAKHLKEFTLASIKERRDFQRKIQMLENAGNESSDYYNIVLPDIKNKVIPLSSLRGKAVLLDFTVYGAEYAPLHNAAINQVYEKYKSGIEVYQVSFDSDLHFWQNAASNLPWICVRDADNVSSGLVYRFNIQQLPATFLLNKEGEIVKRLSAQDNMEEEVGKLL